jgi:hypothetical protein
MGLADARQARLDERKFQIARELFAAKAETAEDARRLLDVDHRFPPVPLRQDYPDFVESDERLTWAAMNNAVRVLRML